MRQKEKLYSQLIKEVGRKKGSEEELAKSPSSRKLALTKEFTLLM